MDENPFPDQLVSILLLPSFSKVVQGARMVHRGASEEPKWRHQTPKLQTQASQQGPAAEDVAFRMMLENPGICFGKY